jgi:hypothetical protein
LTGIDLVQWKKEYKANLKAYYKKHEGRYKPQGFAMVMLDQELEEIVVGNVPSFANNNSNRKTCTTWRISTLETVYGPFGQRNVKTIKERIPIGNRQ